MKRFLLFAFCFLPFALPAATTGNLRTFTSLNSLLANNPTLIGPHVVIESYWPGLGKGGMELVWTPSDATDTNTFSHFKSQSTDWTSPNGRWIAVRNGNNYDVTTGGARGDWPTTADDATAISAMISVLAQNGVPANIIFPVGEYGDPGGILIGKHNGVSYSTVNGIHLIGDVKTASGEPGQVRLRVTDGLAAGILMQNCADCSVENINQVGMNSFFGEAKVDENDFAGTFLDIENFKSSVNTVSTNRYAPHVGIAIDPFSNTTPSQYPGLAANYVGTNGASSSIKILNCTFTDFVAPWVVTPATNGGGVHHFLAENCKTLQSTYGAGFGTSLVDFRIKNHQWRDVFTIFSTDDFGNQTGTIPHAEGHAKFVTYIFQDALTNINANINIEYQNIQAKVVGGAGPEANGTLMIVGSGYDDSGTHFLSDGGGYKTVVSGTTINPTNNFLPYRSNATTFSDSPILRTASDAVTLGRLTVANGTNGTPAITFFSTNSGTGFFRDQSGGVDTSVNGEGILRVLPNGLRINALPGGSIGDAITFSYGEPHLTVVANGVYSGNGSPESVVSANPGSVYLRRDGGAGTVVYVKETGVGNTGWVALAAGGGGSSDNWVANGTTNSLLEGTGFVGSLISTNSITIGAQDIYMDTTVSTGGRIKFGGASATVRFDLNNGSFAFGGDAINVIGDNFPVNPNTGNGACRIELTSDNATAANRTFTMYAGAANGQLVIIEWMALAGELLDDSLLFDTAGHVRLNGDWTPAVYDVLTLIYDGEDWVEISRSNVSAGSGGDALVANPLSQFAATTSAQLASTISDENDPGSGKLVFSPGLLNVTAAKTLAATATLTLSGTDSTVMTFPGASDTVAGLGTAQTFTAAQINSKSGAASTSAERFSGVPFAGTGTTSFPLVYINDANATASTTLSTAGTYLGVNGDGTQDLMNLLKDGTSQLKMTGAGTLTVGASGALTVSPFVVSAASSDITGANYINAAAGYYRWASGSLMFGATSGITVKDSSNTDFAGRFSFGGTTASFPALKKSGTTLIARLADDSANAPFTSDTHTLSGGLIGTPQALSGAGAVNVTTLTTILTSTGVSDALTLANGTHGQLKTIVHTVDGGSAILTPTTKTGFSTVTFTTAGESVTLQYFTTVGWCVIGSYLSTITP